jgi:hypothetical protein
MRSEVSPAQLLPRAIRAVSFVAVTGGISIIGDLVGKEDSKPAISITGTGAGRRSRCEGFTEVIAAKVEAGLSARRIYQDLIEEKGFSDSYQSVQRFVRKLKVAQPQRVWRMEARPGEEVQVDFGLGARRTSFLQIVV